jgi:excisionase family DNA binding protein
MTRAKPPSDWIGVPAAAAHLHVNPKTVYRLIDKEGLPGYRFGRLIRLRRSEVDEWLATRAVEPGSIAYAGAQRGVEPEPLRIEPGSLGLKRQKVRATTTKANRTT